MKLLDDELGEQLPRITNLNRNRQFLTRLLEYTSSRHSSTDVDADSVVLGILVPKKHWI